MAWKLLWQTEKVGKNEMDVLCKRIKFFPIETGTGTEFGSLKFLCLRILIKNDKGHLLTLTLNTARGFDAPGFSVKHPKSVEGTEEKEMYPYQHNFEARLTQLGGVTLKNEVMQHFAERFVGIAQKAAKKAA